MKVVECLCDFSQIVRLIKLDRKKLISLIVAFAALACIVIGVASGDKGNKKAPEPAPTPEVTEAVKDKLINPLTGEKVDEDISMNRPYCVMINNLAPARPSIGLSNASIIYEVLVESNITRMMAIFNDVDGFDIGHVRSCRHYYVSLAQAYDGIYVHWGAYKLGYKYMEKIGYDDIDQLKLGDAPGFFREDGNTAIEHRALIHGTKLAEYAKEHNRMEHEDDFDATYGLSFDKDAVKQCTKESDDIKVVYASPTNTEFKYDKDKNYYIPYVDGKEYRDRTDDTEIGIDNIIILNADYKVLNSKGYKDMDLTGEGYGYFATGGKYVGIKWTRDGTGDTFHYTLKDGTPLNLSIGRTYICIVPLEMGGSVTW